jgi:hypothetical protein
MQGAKVHASIIDFVNIKNEINSDLKYYNETFSGHETLFADFLFAALPVRHGTGTSCPVDATPQTRLHHAPGHLLLMLRTAQASFLTGSQSHLLNSPCQY